MAKGRAVAILLDEGERGELTALTRRRRAPQALTERARIILAAASGLNNKEIAAKVVSVLRRPGLGAIASPRGAWTGFTTSHALALHERSATMRLRT